MVGSCLGALAWVVLPRTVRVMDLTDCPSDECEFTAEVTDRPVLESTDGPIEHVRTSCPLGHWYLMPARMLELRKENREGLPPLPPG